MIKTSKPALLNTIFAITLSAATPCLLQAAPISPDLAISGSVNFDTINSYLIGTPTQGGSISSTIGGATTSSSISGVSLSGTNPLAGTLTDTGDGFGSTFTISSSSDGDNGGLFSDYLFDIDNTSATDQYQVTFRIDLFNNTVDANGVDAYADSQISIFDETNLVEVYFSDLTSDTSFGDFYNGTDLGTFGEALSDNGVFTFDVVIDPMASFQLTGINELEGGIYDIPSDYNGELSSFVSVSKVVNLTTIPVPGSLLLMVSGLLGLAGLMKRKNRI